jgi:4-hydroxy-2-oxoheptanedioate aldolase
MFQRFAADEAALGTIMLARGADWVEIMGDAGMDYVCIDMMMTAIDWAEASEMVRAACRFDMTPWIRLPAYPWGGGGVDHGLAAGTLRGLSIGAEVITASVNTRAQVESLIRPSLDHHRRAYIDAAFHDLDADGLAALDVDLKESTIVMPLLESVEAIECLDDILGLDDLRGVFFGMGDLSRELGHPSEDRHPEVRAQLAEWIDKARAADKRVFVSQMPKLDSDDVAEGAAWIIEHGAHAVWMPYPTYLIHELYRAMVPTVRERVAGGRRDG